MLEDAGKAGAETEADEEAEPDPEPTLSAERLAKVTAIFNAWDYDATGKLELREFSGASVKVGPKYEAKVLEMLTSMDYDGDGYIVPSVGI